MFAEHLPHHIGYLAKGGARFYRREYRRNKVDDAACRSFDGIQRRLPLTFAA